MLVFEYVLILLAGVLLSNLINRFIPSVSVPIIQIILGIIIVLIPFGAFNFEFELEPDLFFVMFIAPLVFNASMASDKKIMWDMKLPIINVSIIPVIINVLAVGYLVYFLIPDIGLMLSFAMIAALSSTDHVAVNSIFKRIKVPHKIAGILEGEAIVSDASGIVCFQFAVTAIITSYFSVIQAISWFITLVFGGIIIGLILTLLKYLIVRWIRQLGMENVTLHLLINILTPFLVYMIAEYFHVSGIIAVFSAGIAHSFFFDKLNPDTINLNIASDSVWSVISFTLDGLVFIMLGTQLPDILKIIREGSFHISTYEVIIYILVITLVFKLIRFLWWICVINIKYNKDLLFLDIGILKSGIIFSLSGVRGTVTLAVVMSLPLYITDGTPFPDRDLIILISSGVIICSLMISNFLLPLFVESKTERTKSEAEQEAYGEIIRNVIKKLNNEAVSENCAATEIVTRNYYNRRVVTLLRKSYLQCKSEEEKDLRLNILKWQKENTLQMISDGKVEQLLGQHYLDAVNEHIKMLLIKKKHNYFMLAILFVKHVLIHKKDKFSKLNQDCFFDLMLANSDYILDKLKKIKEVGTDHILEKIINEYEMHVSIQKSRSKSIGVAEAATTDKKVFEVAAKAFQIERNLIQQMFECGRISRETAKEMRSNISTLEAQIQFDNLY